MVLQRDAKMQLNARSTNISYNNIEGGVQFNLFLSGSKNYLQLN